MSAIALKWVAQTKVGNQTAKQLLLFYASHNFSKPGFEFKNRTLSEQLEVSERAIQEAHRLLQEKKLIRRIAQYDKSGRQLSTLTYLNIPDEYVDDFFDSPIKSTTACPVDNFENVDNSGGEGEQNAGGGRTTCRGGANYVHPLYNVINNKENNKKNIKNETISYESKKQTHVPKKDFQKNDGIIKSTMSDEYKEAKRGSTESADDFFSKLPPHLRPARFRDENASELSF